MLVRRSKPRNIRDILECIGRQIRCNNSDEPLMQIRKKLDADFRSVTSALRDSWCKETCYPPMKETWSKDVPEMGQCAVTAMVVQDYRGGDIICCEHMHHYWNRLPDGREIDLTRSQFPSDMKICEDAVVPRSKFASNGNADTMVRYGILRGKVEKILGTPPRMNIRDKKE